MLLRTTAIALLTVAAVPAAAQSLSGATVNGTYSVYDDFEYFALQGSGEFQITPQFGFGGGLGLYSGDDSTDDLTNITARGLYYFSPESAVGLFFASEEVFDDDLTLTGLEFGFGSAGGEFEAYYAVVDADSFDDAGVGGISFEFAVGQNIFIQGASEAFVADIGTTRTTRSAASIGARYQFAQGPSVFADFGTAMIEQTVGGVLDSESEGEFIAVGAEYSFGGASGALMSNRSVAGALGF